MADNRIDLEITADDQASDVVEDVADAVERLDDETTVEIDADTRDAETAVQRLERELEDTTGDARELRIRFREQQLQRQLRTILRDLERLDDPVEIEAQTRELERAQQELRDLEELASQKYEIEIDADPTRNVQRAGDDLDDLRRRGDGLQSALPAIRGFGDELGQTAQNAGIASQAVGDLGDFALIAGERFATAGSRTAELSTKLGTALGAAGLAGAIGGIVFQVGQQLLPTLRDWIIGSEDVVEANTEIIDSVEGVGEALQNRRFRAAIEDFVAGNDELLTTARRFGITTDELVGYVFRLNDALGEQDNIDKAGDEWLQFEADVGLARETVLRSQADYLNLQNIIEKYVPLLAAAAAEGKSTAEQTEILRAATEDLGLALDEGGDSATEFGDDIADAGETAAGAFDEVQTDLDNLLGTIENEQALAEFSRRTVEAFGEAGAAVITARGQILEYQQDVARTAEQIGNIPPEVVTQMLIEADDGVTIEEAQRTERILQGYANRNPITYPVRLEVTRIPGTTLVVDENGNVRPRGASAGAQATSRSAGTQQATGTTNVTVNLPRVVSARETTRALDRWARVNGTDITRGVRRR